MVTPVRACPFAGQSRCVEKKVGSVPVRACVLRGDRVLSTLGVGCVYWGLSFLMGRSLSSASLTGQCEDGLPCQGCGSLTTHALVRAASGYSPALTGPPHGVSVRSGWGVQSVLGGHCLSGSAPVSIPARVVLHGPSPPSHGRRGAGDEGHCQGQLFFMVLRSSFHTRPWAEPP